MYNIKTENINTLFKNLRLKNKLTQQDIADLLGVSKGYISQIESNNSKYSIKQIQLLMNKFNINLLTIENEKLVKVSDYYYKGALKNNLNGEHYFIANTLNELVKIMREYKKITQQELSTLINYSQNTISSWENNERNIDLDIFYDILVKCDFVNFYISKDKVMVLKPYEDNDLKVYDLAKASCRFIYDTEYNTTESIILLDIEEDSKYMIFYAKNELEFALKMVQLYPKGYLEELIREGKLKSNATYDDLFKLIYNNPELAIWTYDYCPGVYKEEFDGEGLYIQFGDGGYEFSKVSNLLEDIKNTKSKFYDRFLFLDDKEIENIDTIYSKEVNTKLVNRVYKQLLKSIY